MNHVRSSAMMFGLAAVVAGGAPASAAIIFTPTTENQFAAVDPPNSQSSYPLSNTNNLLNGRTGTNVTGTFNQETTTGVTALTDGTVPTLNRTQAANPTGFSFVGWATAGTGTTSGGTSVTYNLAQASLITQIMTYGGWQDNGRDQQSYTVQYSTNGSTFTDIATVNFNPAGVPANRPDATRVTLTSTGDPLTNVVALRFNFNATENGYSGYSELAAYGTPVPEPTSAALLGLASLGLLARRRRRQ